MIDTIEKRKKDIKKIIKGLDITPSMFKNAEDKYKNIAKYLNDKGLNVDISLQGSFAIGTATKPYSNGEDIEYDVDAVCIFKNSSLDSEDIRNSLVSTLNESEVYSGKVTECPKCFTLDYAKLDGYDFSIDLVPSVRKDDLSIGNNVDLKYLSEILSIATKEQDYGWYTINPKGYQMWFNDINLRFASYNKEFRMREFFQEQKVYSKVEDIPEYFNKSSLQEAIQILKRSIDVYFSKIDKEDNKPASIIITTFAALVAQKHPVDIDSIDLALSVIRELNLYSDKSSYDKIISPILNYNGKWEFYNPVNSKDNLLDSWNENKANAHLFFQWASRSIKDIETILDISVTNYVDTLGNSFGNKVTDKVFKRKQVEEISAGAKPYHA